MEEFKLYSVSDEYIKWLQEKVPNVYSNKINTRTHTRKYLGVVLKIGKFNYYVPMSSPKESDYQIAGEDKVIKKSIVPIVRIVVKNKLGIKELKGTLRISHMIPVPESELELYDIENETDLLYKDLVQNEIIFIRKHREKIESNAKVMYKQKISDDSTAGYVKFALDYLKLEGLCKMYERKKMKSILRKEIKEKTSQLSDEYCKIADLAIYEKVANLPEFKAAQNVALFASSFGEPDTMPIIENALSLSKKVALPLCVDGSNMVFKIIESMDDVSAGRYGILEPKEHCCEMDPLSIEFILVPCVTCNDKGHRLGHGRGYYDRFFGMVAAAGGKGLFKCVVCRGKLMSEAIPVDELDISMDAVIWEDGETILGK